MIVDCVRCHKPITVNCTDEQYIEWTRGAAIQQAMPNVPADEREMLISGICGVCWKEIFKDDDDE